MPQKSKSPRTSMSCEILFSNSPEGNKRKGEIFNNISKLIENSDTLKLSKTIDGFAFKSTKTKWLMNLSSDRFNINISYPKKLLIEIDFDNPSENIGILNQIANDILEYINFVLGDSAKESKIIISKMVCKGESTVYLGKKIIGEKRLSELNKRIIPELKKADGTSKTEDQSLNLIGLIFEYLQEDKRYVLGIYSDVGAETIYCYKDYKHPIHSDFLKNEYKELDVPEKLIKNLYQVGLEEL